MFALISAGCVPVYNAQYDDRADELEAFRTEFLGEDFKPKLLASGQQRLYWADQRRPADKLLLRSIIPGDPSSEIEYEWSANKSQGDLEEYRFGEDLIAECSFGTSFAYEPAVAAASGQIAMTSDGGDTCAVDGRSVYFLIGGGKLRKWDPPAPIPDPQNTSFIDLHAAGIVDNVAGFGVIGNTALVVDQTGDLYLVDLVAKQARALHNELPMVGAVFFDERGALYETQSGPRYVEFTDDEIPPDRSFDAMVRDGGYHLNFKHGDIQQPAGNGEYVIHDRHVIYRGQRGIFAYGLDTHHVIDLLLDRGEGIDLEIAYHLPAVTSGGQLFVFGNDSFGVTPAGAVYQVDLGDRLR